MFQLLVFAIFKSCQFYEKCEDNFSRLKPSLIEADNDILTSLSQFSDNHIDAVGSATDTCKRSEPCGWALYIPGSSPRKIYKYTRNILWVDLFIKSHQRNPENPCHAMIWHDMLTFHPEI